MDRVGVRKLKNELSRYLRRVREGQSVVVTDRGEPVARIIPVGMPDEVASLLAEGRLSWSGTRFQPPTHLVHPRPGRPFSEYIAEDRS